MKKVLIITYYWPPSGGAGVQRWLKFTKYLSSFGIQPIVLTVDPGRASYAQRDESLKDEVADELLVYTTKTVELYDLYKKLIGKGEIPYGGFSNQQEESVLQKVAKVVRGNFFIPDPRKGWNRFAYQKAVQLIREHQIDTVITTSPPHSTQMIGLKLKRQLGIRWIADLRDPWTDIYYYGELYRSSWAKRRDQVLELKVLQAADQIVTVSKALKRLFDEKLGGTTGSKILVVPNGYDEDDFDVKVPVSDDKFVITYTGTISTAYDMDGLLRALRELDEQQQKGILFRLVGNIPPVIIDRIRHELPLIELDLVGYVDHAKSVSYLLKSSIQLLIIPKIENNKGIVTGKFYEYLASGKPVLAIGPMGGDLGEVIMETACGLLFDYSDSEGIKKMLTQNLQGSFEINRDRATKYSRRELTQKLVQEIVL
ncbi:glycosyltransferase family 4 protein [Sunxiuqinia sp. sy24]|uniref:glycosyltransferase family 4 protein n=1 Tax=Sunxiuqinia sp. sy24 TaxID=3461495 RepID=UPI004045CB5B